MLMWGCLVCCDASVMSAAALLDEDFMLIATLEPRESSAQVSTTEASSSELMAELLVQADSGERRSRRAPGAAGRSLTPGT